MSGADPDSEGRASARPQSDFPSVQKIRTCRSTSLRIGQEVGRKHPIHLAALEAHNRPILIFVTTSTARRQKILASPKIHSAVVEAWRAASTWLVGRYVIMPDHVHLFCAPNGIEAPSLERWMCYWKSLVTRTLGAKSGHFWLRHHWDRQLRSGERYGNQWEYVRNNPVRHGYVGNANDWPYHGELNELRW